MDPLKLKISHGRGNIYEPCIASKASLIHAHINGELTYDTAVCCSGRLLALFYRGQPLKVAQLDWVHDNVEWATVEQREIALQLARHMDIAGESVLDMIQNPEITRWQTDGALFDIKFTGPTGTAIGPISRIEITPKSGATGHKIVELLLASIRDES